ncbi:MAG TPA: ABC transporter ATP-binding protein [Negativicutes bacterium]|nr:ABC transporter ATP-binding protein [Negativicutes bacterium]
MEAIRMDNLVKTYGSGSTAVHAIKNVSLYVNPGEVVGLLGPSGSGKTTLLQCLGAVIDPTAGRIELNGETIFDNGWKLSDLRALRRDKIGFVFQAAYLIPFLSVLDNVALLPMLAEQSNAMARKRAMELLTILEVEHRAHAKPSELSGGEQQRVAIARAMANQPPFILADEPTAPLDSERSLIVMKLLARLAQEYNTAIMVVTHDDIIIPRFKRLYRLRDGVAHEEAGQGLPFPD